MPWQDYIPEEIRDLYELHNFHHAAEILSVSYPTEFAELMDALRQFRFTREDILRGGGNESEIPKIYSRLLHPLGWYETRIQGNLLIRKIVNADGEQQIEETTIEGFIDGHKVDYVKNQVACDLEWNSKDQTFDRDLYAFRAFHECRLIGAAVLVTRSADLNFIFREMGVFHKFGASTTWMGKLLPRIQTGRNGVCPVLVVGITPRLIREEI